MPPNYLETRMDAGDAAVSHAPKSVSSRQARRGLSDAAIRAAKPSEKAYKLPAGGSLYLEVSPSGANKDIGDEEGALALHGRYLDFSNIEAAIFG
jgi:hypothetical protein